MRGDRHHRRRSRRRLCRRRRRAPAAPPAHGRRRPPRPPARQESAGRRRGAARSGVRSRRRRSRTPPPAAVTQHQLGRAATDVDDQHGTRPAVPEAADRPRRRTGRPPRRRSAPRVDPEPFPHPGGELRRRCRRRAPPRWRRTAAARHPAAARPPRSRRSRPACAPTPRAAIRPVRSTPCPSLVTCSSRARSVCCAGRRVEVGHQQLERVGAAVERGHPHEASVSTQGPARPPRLEPVERLVAQPVGARPLGERVPDQHVQALHPVRHAPGGHAVDLGHLGQLLPAREVGPVRPGVGLRQLRVVGQAVSHLPHQTGRLERSRPHRPAAGR